MTASGCAPTEDRSSLDVAEAFEIEEASGGGWSQENSHENLQRRGECIFVEQFAIRQQAAASNRSHSIKP